MNPIKKIMSTKYKYAFVAAIIMIVMFVLGVIVIQGMINVITEQQITYTDTIVSDKYLDESNGHFYIVVGNDNKTFDIQIRIGENTTYLIPKINEFLKCKEVKGQLRINGEFLYNSSSMKFNDGDERLLNYIVLNLNK